MLVVGMVETMVKMALLEAVVVVVKVELEVIRSGGMVEDVTEIGIVLHVVQIIIRGELNVSNVEHQKILTCQDLKVMLVVGMVETVVEVALLEAVVVVVEVELVVKVVPTEEVVTQMGLTLVVVGVDLTIIL